MAVTGRFALLVALGALVVGLALPSLAGVAVVTAVLVVAALVDVAAAVPVGSLRLERDGGETVTLRLGESHAVDLLVANPSGRRAALVVRDAWEPSAGAVPPRHRVTVPAGERRRVTATLTPTRRGDRDAARVTVRSLGPLGLAGRQGSRVVPARVRVLPPFGSRRHLPSRLARLRELDGRRAVQIRGQGTEFDSLREYVAGDDVRSIDWRASARSPELVVRTWRPERDRHVLVVLDTGRTSAARVGDAPRLDAALDTALLLATLAARGGDRVDLLALDREVRASVLGARPGDLLPSLVTAMAALEPRLVETDMRLLASTVLASTVLARAGRRSLVVVLTSLDEAAVADGLEPVLGALLHRHTVLVASVADPELARLARGRGETEAVYTAAAAQVARAARDRVAERLGHRGVEVVDAAPDDLPPAVADRYLALKAAGRL